MSLTKDDVVKALVKETGCQLNQSVEMIETLLELIKFTLADLISGKYIPRLNKPKNQSTEN